MEELEALTADLGEALEEFDTAVKPCKGKKAKLAWSKNWIQDDFKGLRIWCQKNLALYDQRYLCHD